MNKRIISVVLFLFLTAGIYGESPEMQEFVQRFVRADLAGKIDILYEAYSNESNSTSLYLYALQFVLDNYAQIGDLRDMNAIVSISLNGLRNIDGAGEDNVISVLWKLFLEYPGSNIKTEIILTLGQLARGNTAFVNDLNNYLMELNMRFRAGESVDYMIVSACISAIMELADSSSYPVLFAVISFGYPELLSSESYGALEVIPGNLQQFLLNVIANNPPDEKFAAFRAVINSNRLTIPERGQLAELALAQSLLTSDDNVDLTAMRYAAILKLTQLRWTRANALAIRHYYRIQADYNQELVSKERFLEAIACLGALGNSDAALVLGLQLGLINIRTESTGIYDPEITLAIVQSLGLIGDNAAFNHLSYVTNLPYNNEIIAAAREAISRLKW